jgi:signal transduction histidine kinase
MRAASDGLAAWVAAPERPATVGLSSGGHRARVLAGVLLTALIVALETLPDTRSNEAVAIAALDALQNSAFVWAGVLGTVLRPRTLLGPVMMAVGVCEALGNLVFAETVPFAYTVGLLSIGLFAAPLSHVLLSYPDGRLRTSADRRIVGATYLHLTVQWWTFVLVHDPQAAGCRRCGENANLIGVLKDGGTYEVLVLVQIVVSVVLAVLVLWRLAHRWRSASPVGRDLLAPVLAGGLFCASITLATAPFAYATLDASGAAVILHGLWAVAFGAIPLGYVVGLVRDTVRRTRLAVLLAELSVSTEAEPLLSAVRRALGDPTANVFVGGDAELRRALDEHPGAGRRQALHRFGNGAVLVHDPALRQDTELVSGVARAVAFALENRRLEHEVRQRLLEAEAARSRVVAAGDEARRRIERDLHDGLQQTLISLSLTLRVLDEDASLGAEEAGLLQDALTLSSAATQDLRSLAAGVYPMVLTAGGLSPALAELAASAPVGVTVDLRSIARSTPEAEAAAYFCCREAVTNVVKHAGASRCTIRGRLADGVLRLQVLDDGVGGAALDRGSGLRGLADRAAAVGGRIDLESPIGGPTLVRLWIPWPAAADQAPDDAPDAASLSLLPPGR